MGGNKQVKGAWDTAHRLGYIPAQGRRAGSAKSGGPTAGKAARGIGNAFRLRDVEHGEAILKRYTDLLEVVSPAASSRSAPNAHLRPSSLQSRPHSAPQGSQSVPKLPPKDSYASRPLSAPHGSQSVPKLPPQQPRRLSSVESRGRADQRGGMVRPGSAFRLSGDLPMDENLPKRPGTAPSRTGERLPNWQKNDMGWHARGKSNIRELVASLDKSYAPSMIQLRLNNRNMIKKLMVTGYGKELSRDGTMDEMSRESAERSRSHPTATSGEQPKHQGVMWRLQKHGDPTDMEHWWRREFSFSKSWDLRYYSVKNEDLTIMYDYDRLSRGRISSCSRPSVFPYTIVLSIPSGDDRVDTKYLACESRTAFVQWMDKFGQVMDGVMEVAEEVLQAHPVPSVGQIAANGRSGKQRSPSTTEPELQGALGARFGSTKNVSMSPDSSSLFSSRQGSKSQIRSPDTSASGTPRDQDGSQPFQRTKNRRQSLVASMLTDDLAMAMEDHEDIEGKRKALLEELVVWRQRTYAMVFDRFQDEGEIHRDDMQSALDLFGFLEPTPSTVNDVFTALTSYNTLDAHEFVKFVEGYAEQHFEMCAQAFRDVAEGCQSSDPSMPEGNIPITELSKVLKSCGILAIPRVLKEIVSELVSPSSTWLSLESFKEVVDVLHLRQGFCVRDLDRFRDAFKRFAAAGASMRRMPTSELSHAITWLGFTQDEQDISAIGTEVDSGANSSDSGGLNEHEFIVCCRKIRDLELTRIEEVLVKYDADGSGDIDMDELDIMLRAFGYIPERQAIEEVCEEVGAGQAFGVFELLRFLEIYRSREGFTAAEAEEIDNAFHKYDRDQCGEICTVAVGKVLRHMGYLTTFELQQQLVAEVDVDHSGKLSIPELRKLVRKYRELEIQRTRTAFKEYDFDSKGLLHPERATQALQSLGCNEESLEKDTEIAKTPVLDVFRFIHIATLFREKKRVDLRDNSGFTPEELADFQKKFEKYDTDGSGEIANREMQALLEDLFPPDAATSRKHAKQQQKAMLKLLSEVDDDGDGAIDFDDFVRLMRQFYDNQERERVEQEQRVVRQTGFTRVEVEGFRELFMHYAQAATEERDEADDAANAEMTFPELKFMIGTICPLGTKRIVELTEIFKDVMTEDDDDTKRAMRFPDFLLLMRRLLDVNFAGIREQSEKVVATKARGGKN